MFNTGEKKAEIKRVCKRKGKRDENLKKKNNETFTSASGDEKNGTIYTRYGKFN